MINQYGLDYSYFKKKLEILARDCGNYRPSEMANELESLTDVACEQMENDPKAELFRNRIIDATEGVDNG